jgi:glutamate-ammonia-ligase adenylyltransferase
MRLRPFGNSGPLAICFDAMEHYYLSHGREWERYAMIKARPLNGDTPATKALMSVLRPFVFRRYLDFGVYEALRDMKQRIELEMKRKGMHSNIKLGAGGIREVEFIGQAFQLIRGGREPALQTRQIIGVLELLAQYNVLPGYVISELIDAYTFLRLTENRLQQFNDQQTHILPANADRQQCLALAMGFDDWGAFKKTLDAHRQRVHEHFQQVFAAPQIGQQSSGVEAQQLLNLWRGDLSENQGVELLQNLGFSDAETLRSQITELRKAQVYRTLSGRGKERLDQLMPLLIAAAARYGHAGLVMQRVLGLIQAVAKRSSYLSLLAEYPMALSQLVKLCAASSWIATNLSKYPILLDELLDPRTLYRPPTRVQLEQDIDKRLSVIAENDLEQQMDALRHFKLTNVLRVAAADIADAVPLMVVSDHLTYIAEVVLNRVLTLAWEHVIQRHGVPQDKSGTTGFAVIAYGKLGGIELSYGSDLDLVFIYDADPHGETDGEKVIANSVFYSRLGQRMIHILTAFTPAGELYDVDMRLRPSGESGLLVTHIDRYKDYQLNKAWTWEHQALVRTRAVAGDGQVIEAFNSLREQVLRQRRDLEKLREDVTEMRARMRAELDRTPANQFDLKQGEGGIADIEFMVQYMVLGWAFTCPGLSVYSDNIRILESAVHYGLLSAEQGRMVMDIYRRLRARVHRLALQEQSAVVDNSQFTEERRAVAEIWRFVMSLGALDVVPER